MVGRLFDFGRPHSKPCRLRPFLSSEILLQLHSVLLGRIAKQRLGQTRCDYRQPDFPAAFETLGDQAAVLVPIDYKALNMLPICDAVDETAGGLAARPFDFPTEAGLIHLARINRSDPITLLAYADGIAIDDPGSAGDR